MGSFNQKKFETMMKDEAMWKKWKSWDKETQDRIIYYAEREYKALGYPDPETNVIRVILNN